MDLFRKCIIKGKHKIAPTDTTALTGPEPPDKPGAAIDEILATRTSKTHEAVRLAFAFAYRHRPELLLSAARRLLAVKCRATHTTSNIRWRFSRTSTGLVPAGGRTPWPRLSSRSGGATDPIMREWNRCGKRFGRCDNVGPDFLWTIP